MASEFQDFPLPAIQDNQDFVRLVPPNSEVEIPAVGEFVYCKFSDGSVLVEINGKTTEMEPGDFRKMGGQQAFRGVKLINRTNVAKSTVFVIGFGDYDRKIVSGEITTITGVRAADGSFVADTRYEVDAFISPVYGDTSGQVARGFVYGQFPLTNNVGSMWESDQSIKFHNPSTGILYILDYQLNMLATVNDENYLRIADDVINSGYVGLRVGNNGVWKYDKTSTSYTLLFNAPDADRIVAGNGEYLLVTDGSPATARFYSPEGVLRKTVNLNDIVGGTYVLSLPTVTYDSVNNQWVFFKGNTNGTNEVVIFDYDLTQVVKSYAGRFVDDISIITSASTSDRCIVVGGVGYFFSTQLDSVVKAQFDTIDYAFRGVAFSAGCENDLYKPGSDSPPVTASLDVIEEGGRLIVQGEVIKAVLELYFNATVDPSYMDSVFNIEIYNTGGRQVTKSAGGRGLSMAALGIEDNFRAVFPGRVRLLVDTRLKTFERVA